VQAELAGAADLVRQPGRGDGGLAGRAAEVDAATAQMLALEQHHAASRLAQGSGQRHAALAAADNGELGFDRGHRTLLEVSA